MYYRDHLPPHFHAIYGDTEAIVSLLSLDVIEGNLPPRARRLVIEWARLRRPALLDDWERACVNAPLSPIPPLD